MIENYIKIALRNIARNKLYSLLNITGLAIGIACSILILLYVQDELSFDRFHEHANRIYRLVPTFKTQERTMLLATTTHAQAGMIQAEYPEVENFVRFSSYGSPKIIRYGESRFNEDKFVWVDQSLFTVFSFELVRGDVKNALVNPNSIVLTEEMATKYFGTDDPIGKNLEINGKDLYAVTGVMENLPRTSHIRPDFFASFSTLDLKPAGNAVADMLNQINYYTYLLIREGTDVAEFDRKLEVFVDKHIGTTLKQLGGEGDFDLQALTSIHLHSNRDNEIERNSDIAYVWLFIGIGLFILLLACLNFMNLTTARSANRAKEVGLRKVIGAQKKQLVRQFLGESFILTFISLLFSVLMVMLTLPLFRTISGKYMDANVFSNHVLLLGLGGIFLVVGFVGGSYPAFFLSAFRPVEVIQGQFKRGAKNSILRIVLVSIQFTVSIVLIIGTLVINKQLNYIRNRNLGYDKDHVVAITVRSSETGKKLESIRIELLQNPAVLKVSASSTPPLGITDFSVHHGVGKPSDEQIMLSSQIVDENFLDTYDIELAAGRNFSKAYPSDPAESIIVNETAARTLGWQDDPLSHEIERYTITTDMSKTRKWRIVGVVKDYHFQSLHEPITPMILYNANPFDADGAFSILSVRVRPDNVQSTIEFLRRTWAEFDPVYPFEYEFVDSLFDELYRTEVRLQKLFRYFTILAVFIGCLGLFGLTSFTAEQRKKEIGIRKVLGASISGIIAMQVRDFTKWVLLAVVIAWPIGYFVMNSWLQNFAYRFTLGIDIFLLSAFLALMISIATVSYQTVKAAVANPAEAIKYE